MLLFEQLLDTVPERALLMWMNAIADGRKLRFDHGALRTVLTTGTGACRPAKLPSPGYCCRSVTAPTVCIRWTASA